MLALGLLLALTPQGSEAPEPHDTLVRVVGEDGSARAAARVLVVTAPFPGEDRPSLSRTREHVADDGGRVRVRLEAGRLWGIWAVWHGEDVRFASPIRTQFDPSRPLRLVVRRFEAFRVRWLGLPAWRAAVGPLSSRFIVDKSTLPDPAPASGVAPLGIARSHDTDPLAGFLCPTFALPVPENETAALELPPLPLHPYYAVLTDADGGFLDVRFMNPNFHSKAANAQVQHLYERERSLKRLALGEPIRVRGVLRDENGQPVTGARVFLRPQRAKLQAERRHVSDADGAFTMHLPYRDPKAFGRYDCRLYVCAEGFQPSWFARANPKSQGSFEFEHQLRRGRTFDWRLRGLRAEDRRPERLLLRTYVQQSPRSRSAHTFPIEVAEDGRLRLPAPLQAGRDELGFDLYLLRDGRPIPIWLDRGQRTLSRLEIDLDQIRTVRITATDPRGRPAAGAVARLFRDTNDPVERARFHLGADGGALVPWMPSVGTFVTVSSTRRGDGYAAVAPQTLVSLQPSRLVSGSVRTEGGEPAPGAVVTLQCTPPNGTAAAIQAMLAEWNRSVVCDARGHFEVRSTSRAKEIFVTTTVRVGKRHLAARGAISPTAAQRPIELVLGRSEIQRW